MVNNKTEQNKKQKNKAKKKKKKKKKENENVNLRALRIYRQYYSLKTLLNLSDISFLFYTTSEKREKNEI